MPEPTPSKGQALVRTHSCGLCASDQHYLHSGKKLIEMSKRYGGSYAALDFSRPVIPGHEYVGEVLNPDRAARHGETRPPCHLGRSCARREAMR